jgi:signal transduction histidine kinase
MASMSRLGRLSLDLKIAVVLLVLLVILAGLQYRWTGEVSRAERERMQASLIQAVARFTDDFDRELARAFFHFFIDPRAPGASPLEAGSAERFRRWRMEAPYPELVQDLFLVERRGGATSLLRLDPDSGEFAPAEWPKDFDSLQKRLEAGEPGRPSALAAEVPALVIPAGRFDDHDLPHSPDRIVLRLSERFIVGELLPDLTHRYFGGVEGLDYVVAVIDREDRSRIVYQTEPLPAGFLESADLRGGLFSLRGGGPPRPPGERTERAGPRPRPSAFFRRGFSRRFPGGPPEGAERGWEVVVRHRSGSLETAVARARWRNLGVSLGILALLGASMVLLFISTRRARQLARQQMDFVAGVSHELRTPLAVMRSAAQNLAEGAVDDRKRTAEYGALIEKEGQRLSDLVDQVLEFAALQSDRQAYAFESLTVPAIVEAALASCEPLIHEEDIVLEKTIAPELPRVQGDASALRQAVQNLVVNAINYGGSERWVGLSVSSNGTEPKEVLIRVSDRGPGIDPEDLPHLFEPFYRGREASRARRRGSGLGLSLVQRILAAHRGRVSVESLAGRGSAFTLHLPAEGGGGEERA